MGRRHTGQGLDIDIPSFPGPVVVVVPQIDGEVHRGLESEKHRDPTRDMNGTVLGRHVALGQQQIRSTGPVRNEVELRPAPTEVLQREPGGCRLLENAAAVGVPVREGEVDDAVLLVKVTSLER